MILFTYRFIDSFIGETHDLLAEYCRDVCFCKYKESFRINKITFFSCQEKNVEDLGVTIHSCDAIWVPEKAVKLDNSLFYYKSNLADGDISFYLWDTFQKQAIYQLKVNQEWNKAQMIYQKEQDIRYALTGPLGEILFEMPF